jgi:hypothetical protein
MVKISLRGEREWSPDSNVEKKISLMPSANINAIAKIIKI